MSDQWFYRIYGQEFGPVSLDLVRSLVLSGTIAPDDEVRNGGRSTWILACAAAELRDSLNSWKSDHSIERRNDRDQWFCRGANGEVGPLNLIDLIQLAIDGHLKPHEEIKSRVDDYWKQISSIERLIELLPFGEQHRRLSVGKSSKSFPLSVHGSLAESKWNSAKSGNPSDSLESSVVSDLDQAADHEMRIVQFPGIADCSTVSGLDDSIDDDGSAEILQKEMNSVTWTDSDYSDGHRETNHFESAQWTGWIGGEEFGPIRFSELLSWAVTGRISPLDFVCREPDGQLIPAVHIPGLFTVQAAINLSSIHGEPVANESLSLSNHQPLVDDDFCCPSLDASVLAEWTIPLVTVACTDLKQESDLTIEDVNPQMGVPAIGKPDPLDWSFGNLISDPQTLGLSAMVILGAVVVIWAAGL